MQRISGRIVDRGSDNDDMMGTRQNRVPQQFNR